LHTVWDAGVLASTLMGTRVKYAGLNLKALIMHEVVSKGNNDGQPILSDVPAPMDEANRAFIQERIRRALSGHARPITEDGTDSSVPKLIREFLDDPSDLAELSRALVTRLQQCQHRLSPGGIFLAALADFDSEDALVLAKLEHEKGVRARQTELADGSTTFDMQLLKDLLFTTGSKVFKVALFSGRDVVNGTLSGVVVDKQISGSGIAQYFLADFLGSRFSERADLLTQRFHDAAQAWLNRVPDGEKKARYEVALLGELQSNSTTLSINSFAHRYLDVDDRDGFSNDMQASGVPTRDFDKELRG